MNTDIKSLLRPLTPEPFIRIYRGMKLAKLTESLAERECPGCGSVSHFGYFGHPPRIDARCPQCGSLERHRLLILALQRGEISFPFDLSEARMLHFAPEAAVREYFSRRVRDYVTADLFRDDVDKNLNIENIADEDATYDVILASHILEHVDDRKAASELARILKSDGCLLAMVPIVDAWKTSYENEVITTESDRELHFGQLDHVRYFGSDFVDRMESGGLKLDREIVAFGEDCVRYSLTRGEKIFVFRKAG